MAPNKLVKKLLRIERSVHIYDNLTEDLTDEISISIPLEKLKKIVSPNDDDPLLYLGYMLDAKQLEMINHDTGNSIKIDLDLYYYILDCTGVYNF